MIQDYFSIDKKGKDYYLLRILNKVDFDEEVVWAHDATITNPAEEAAFASLVVRYLTEGFDSLESWKGDQEGFHSSIQHFGFDPVVYSGNLIPLFLLRENGTESLLCRLFDAMNEKKDILKDVLIETRSGSLHQALSELKAKTFKPKDPNANVPIPLGLAFEKRLDEIGALLKNYS